MAVNALFGGSLSLHNNKDPLLRPQGQLENSGTEDRWYKSSATDAYELENHALLH